MSAEEVGSAFFILIVRGLLELTDTVSHSHSFRLGHLQFVAYRVEDGEIVPDVSLSGIARTIFYSGVVYRWV